MNDNHIKYIEVNETEDFWKTPTSDEFKKKFGENLRKVRVRFGMSQKTLSELMNVPAPTISRYERGLMEPTLSTAKLIAEILFCTIDELAGHNSSKYEFEAIAQQWNKLLSPSFSVTFDKETGNFIITVLEEMETMLYRFKAGKKLIMHYTAFSKYEENIIEMMDKDLYKNKKELAVLYFSRMIETIQFSSGLVLPNKDKPLTEG